MAGFVEKSPESMVPLEEIEIRSLYMRLYRSYRDGEVYPYNVAGPEIEYLLDACHVEQEPGGYRLTLAGVQAWAELNRYILAGTPNLARNAEQSDVLRSLLPYLTDKQEDTMSKLIDGLKQFLLKIDSHIPTVVRGADKTVLMTAVRQKYAEKVGDHLYCITDAGRAWLKENGAPVQHLPVAEFNPNALIHRLLAGQTIMRAELTTKEEQDFFRRLVRDVHVTVHGDGYAITRAGREALEDFGEPAPEAIEPESEPEPSADTAFSEPVVEAAIEPAPAADVKPAKRPYTRRLPRATGGAVDTQAEIAADSGEPEKFIPSDTPVLVALSHSPVADQADCTDCDCLPKRVLAAVIEARPDVRELFELMQRQERLLKNLGKR